MKCNLYKGVANRNSGIREITKNHIRKRKEGKNAKGDEKFGTSFVRIECIALLYKF